MSKPKEAGADRAAVLARFALAKETAERLEIYAALLAKWQATINLVAPSTLPQLWTRHIADSLQVSAALPDAKLWLDMGSGAGFPGLVTAIRLAETPSAKVHLVESDQRKAAFLRDVSRETGAPTVVHVTRVETLLLSFADPIEAVSARALAPLPQLICLAESLLEKGATGVFPQGEKASAELTDSRLTDRFSVEKRQSTTSPGAWLALVRAFTSL